MKIPNPYFKEVPEIGDLKLDYTFFEDTYPIFFTCTDRNNKLYICTCCDIREEQRWIISPVKSEDVIHMMKNEVSLFEIFKIGNGKRYVITWRDGSEKVKVVEFSELNILDLPKDNEYYDADEDEYLEYKRHFDIQSSVTESVDEISISDELKNSMNNITRTFTSNMHISQELNSYITYINKNSDIITRQVNTAHRQIYDIINQSIKMRIFDIQRMKYNNNISDNSLLGEDTTSKHITKCMELQFCN